MSAARFRGRGILLSGLLLLSLFPVSCTPVRPPGSSSGSPPAPSFVVYYGDAPRNRALSRVDWAIVPDSHPLPSATRTVFFAYLSVGEADRDGAVFRELSARPQGMAGLSLGENRFWHATVLDIRKEAVRQALLDSVARDVRKGFGGVFLDTLDSPLEYRREHPVAGRGIGRALASLVGMIHASYPQLRILANRGFEILPEIASDLTGVLYEDFCSRYDQKTKSYVEVPEKERTAALSAIRRARRRNPSLAVLALDYDDPAEPRFRVRCRTLARRQGFAHFDSDLALDRAVPEEGGR